MKLTNPNVKASDKLLKIMLSRMMRFQTPSFKGPKMTFTAAKAVPVKFDDKVD